MIVWYGVKVAVALRRPDQLHARKIHPHLAALGIRTYRTEVRSRDVSIIPQLQLLKLALETESRAKPDNSTMASQEKNEAMLAIAREMDNVPWCEDYERMVSGML